MTNKSTMVSQAMKALIFVARSILFATLGILLLVVAFLHWVCL